MKIVHLLPAMEQGGVETVVCDLVKALSHCESLVISKGGRLVERIQSEGGRHIALNLKSKNPLTYFLRAWKLREVLRNEKPDLVCVHSRVPAWLFVWANRGLNLHWITYAHGANSVSRYSEIMTKGDLVITPSRFLADYLKLHYGLSESKIRVIPHAIDAVRFDPERLDSTFIAEKRQEWNIRDGRRVAMVIGRITPVKGLDNLIRTTPVETKLIIVGGADRHHRKYLDSLKALAGPNVIFAGPQTKIPECLSIADEIISANTTKPESFGLSVVEAYAMNKPVRVTRRFGGVAEVMEAVEKAGKPTLREAVLDLYGVSRWTERTLLAYREVMNMV